MDEYLESIAVHEFDAKNKRICVISVMFGLLLCSAAFLFFDWYTVFIVMAVSYAVYRIICTQNYEYEYIFDGHSLSVFKIINKSSRKKLFFAPVDRMISFTEYHGEPLSGYILRADAGEKKTMVLKISDTNQTKLLFSPNEKMTAALHKHLNHY